MTKEIDLEKLLPTLTMEELRYLNKEVVHYINQKHREEQQKAAAKFKIGDVVWFDSRKGYRVTIKIFKINAKSLSGRVTKGPHEGMQWNVSPTMCHKGLSLKK